MTNLKLSLLTNLSLCFFIPSLLVAQTAGQIIQSGHSTVVNALTFCENNNRLISAGRDNFIILWDVWSGRAIKQWKSKTPLFELHRDKFSGQIALTGQATATYLIDPQIDSFQTSNFDHPNIIHQAKIADSGFYLIETDYNGGVYINSKSTNIKTEKIKDSVYVEDFTFMPASKNLILTYDSAIYLLNPFTHSEKKIYKGKYPITHIAISASGKRLIFSERYSTDNFHVSLIDLDSGTPTDFMQSENEIVGLHMLYGNDSIIVVTRMEISIWNIPEKREKLKMISPDYSQQLGFCVSSDENYIATSYSNGDIVIWDLLSGTKLKTLKSNGNSLMIESAAINRTNKQLYTSCHDDYIRIWDIASQRLIGKLRSPHDFAPFEISFTNDSNMITIGSDKIITTKNALSTIRKKSSGAITHACISKDQTFIAACKYDTLLLINTKTYKILKPIILPDMGLQIAISPNNKQIAISLGDGSVWLYNLAGKGRKLMTTSAPIQSLAFSGKGTILCAGCRDNGLLLMLHLSNGRLLKWQGHSKTVSCISWISDTSFLSGDETGEIKQWDLNGNEKCIFQGHTRWITSLLPFHYNNLLISTSFDGDIKYWNLLTGQLLSTLKAVGAGTDNFIAYTPQGYYAGTKQGIRSISYLNGTNVQNFEQFDLYYNRPDTILRSIGLAPQEEIIFMKKLYEKRIYNIDSGLLSSGKIPFADVPVLSVNLNTTKDGRTKIKDAELVINAYDTKYELSKLSIYANGVPIFGTHGISLSDHTNKLVNYHVSVQLSHGENTIEVSVMNNKQIESTRKSIYLFYY